MSETERRPRARVRRIALGVAALAVAVLGTWALREQPQPPEVPGETPAGPEAEAPKPTPVQLETTSFAAPLPPNGRLQLSHARLAEGGPVVVHLGLPEPSRDDAPRPVRLVSQPDHRILELAGALGPDRTATAIEIDPAFLRPGAYLVEVKTTERTHFPLRRYAIVVGE